MDFYLDMDSGSWVIVTQIFYNLWVFMRVFFYCSLLCASCFCHADLTPYLKKDTAEKIEKCPIKNIDFIYMINLDHRPEKFQKSLDQLKPYKITPHRFSAIYGTELPPETINSVGLKFMPGMNKGKQPAVCFSSDGPGNSIVAQYKQLNEDSYGKTAFYRTMTVGTIGCSMSHLSVLQDAYDAGFETIWVMEDDIVIKQDPHKLSSLVKKLDKLVGKKGWDILYTDTDGSDALESPLYNKQQDLEKDLTADLSFYERPDMNLSDRSSLAKRSVLSEDFVKIGSRMRTHSMIIRRAGMKKILDFANQHHIFIPYDHEIALVPNIQMFRLRYDLATFDTLSQSDTHTGNNSLCAATAQDPFFELYAQGLSQKKANNPDAALEAFFKSYAMRPNRAEPLLQCAIIHREKNNVFLGYLLTKHALSLPYPKNELFVEEDTYSYNLLIEFANCALLLGNFDEGFEACGKLLSNPYLPSAYRPSVVANYELARSRLGNTQPNISANSPTSDPHIHDHGYWIGTDIMDEHKHDPSLAKALADFFQKEKAKNVVDFGCGPGNYVKSFREQKIQCEGYDGNPDSAIISNGLVKTVDLAEPFDLKKHFDWVLCLEVGEHLPQKYEKTLIENLDKHNVKGIVLSWAIKGQTGFGHFNEQDNEYVKQMMADYGYENDLEAETNLRKNASLPWFQNTIMVFRKK